MNLTEKLEELLISAADGWLAGSALSGTQRQDAVGQIVEWLFASLLMLGFAAPALAFCLPLPLAISIAMFAASIPLAATALLTATGRLTESRICTLIAASAALAWLVVANGGLASPFVFLAILLPLEAGLVSRSRQGVATGVVAAFGVLATVGLASPGAIGSALVPGAMTSTIAIGLLYAATRGMGLAHGFQGAESAQTVVEAPAATTRPQTDGWDVLDRLPGLVTLHDRDGKVARAGGAEKAVFEEWMGSAEGGGYLARIHVADRIVFLNAFDCLRRGDARCRVDVRMERLKGDSQFTHLAVDLMAERDDNGAFCGAVVQSRDVSRLIENHTQLADAARQAEDSNEAKSRFLAAVSHELRTPLNAIIGFSDILAREYFGAFNDERQREYVGLIHQSGHHLLALVNTMLDMSKIEAGRYELFAENFAIGEVVTNCEAMLGLQASDKGVTVTHRISRQVGEVNADRRAVQQILINLVGNAIKFTETGGVVTTDVELRGSDLRMIVSDTGIGMPESQLERVGEPFLQGQNSLSRNYEGTGLGLSLVKGLVALHGGQFAIESREGEGTRVIIDLPVDGSGIEQVAQQQVQASGPVAFPPRLEKADATKTPKTEKLEMSDDATARIA